MATAPKVPLPIHEIENVLAFDQEKIVKAGQTETFGTLDTSRFDKIRLVAANEQSTCNVHVWLKIMEPEGGKVEERFILDEFTLQPHNQLTRVYDVPATKLEVSMVGVGRPGTQAEVEVLIYGQY
jgi:type III secretion protein HrpB1